MTLAIEHILEIAPVIPVLVIDDLATGVRLAECLVESGLRVLEITLRTPVALDAVRAIRAALPEAIVGVGTVLDEEHIQDAGAAGAQFLVSPGSTPTLLDAAADSGIPLLPGAATASEAMRLLERGYRHLKFFPAEAAGGVALLRALAGPLPQLRFCPTGGITPEKAPHYLALPNVACIGGSWMAEAKLVKAGHWTEIAALAQQAAHLPRHNTGERT